MIVPLCYAQKSSRFRNFSTGYRRGSVENPQTWASSRTKFDPADLISPLRLKAIRTTLANSGWCFKQFAARVSGGVCIVDNLQPEVSEVSALEQTNWRNAVWSKRMFATGKSISCRG